MKNFQRLSHLYYNNNIKQIQNWESSFKVISNPLFWSYLLHKFSDSQRLFLLWSHAKNHFWGQKNHPPSWWSLFLGFGYEKYNLTSFFSPFRTISTTIFDTCGVVALSEKNSFYVKTFIQFIKMSKKDQSYTFKTVYKWILF